MRSGWRLALLTGLFSTAACDYALELQPVFERYPATADTALVYASAAVRNPTVGTRDLLLDVYRPVVPTFPPLRPAVVVVHDGGFSGGSRRDTVAVHLADFFSHRGYIAVAIDHRLTTDDPPTEPYATDSTSLVRRASAAARIDAASAVAWLRLHAAEYRLDPERIAIAGVGSGAVAALGAAYWADGPQRADVAAVISISGGLFGSETQIESGEPPVMVVFGERSSARDASIAIAQRASAVGVYAEMWILPDSEADTPEALSDPILGIPLQENIGAFLYEQMGLDALLGIPETWRLYRAP